MRFQLPKLFLSVCFYVALIRGTNMGLFYPSDEALIGEVDYTAQMIMNIILLLGVAAYFFTSNNYIFFKKIMTQPLILMSLAGIGVSAAFSIDKEQSVKFLLAVTVLTLPGILYVHEYGAEKTIRALAKFIIAAAAVNLSYVLLFPDYGIMTGNHSGMWRGLFEHKNGASGFFAIGFYILLSQMRGSRFFAVIIHSIALIISVAFIALSQSTTGTVAWLVGGFIYAFYNLMFRLPSGKERAVLALLIVAIWAAFFVLCGNYFVEQFFIISGKDPTLTGRTGLWKVLSGLSFERPLIGWGPGMSERPEFMQRIQGDVGWEAKGTHNSYLDVIIGCGYPAGLMMIFIFFKIFFQSFNLHLRTRKEHAMTVVSLVTLTLVLMLSGLGSGALYSRSIFWMFAVIAASVLYRLKHPTIAPVAS